MRAQPLHARLPPRPLFTNKLISEMFNYQKIKHNDLLLCIISGRYLHSNIKAHIKITQLFK